MDGEPRKILRMRSAHGGELPAHAWPGGYQMIYVTRDGETVCPKCANEEHDASQAVIDGDVFWEGPAITCDDCGELIESSYGDPDSDN